MKKCLLFVSFVACSVLISAQSTKQKEELSKERIEQISQLNQQFEGTYQIQMIDTRKQPALPFDLVERVNAVRKQNEETFFYLDSNIRVRVLPKSVIDRAGFNGLQKVVYVSSKDL